MTTSRKSVTLLGSTGSIGTQALDVITRNAGLFEVYGLAAGGSSLPLLAEQIRQYAPAIVAVHNSETRVELENLLAGVENPPQLLFGPEAASVLASHPVDVVLNGMTGAVGLGPTLAALRANNTLALANKESLVIGGQLVKEAMKRSDQIVPVDSEHSAMAQALRGGRREEVTRFILTASGGPFRGMNREQLQAVTPEEALDHPTWNMGPVVTINSSTLVNKALELIEAHLLFDVPVDDIVVVVHPQSIVHSMIEFTDGSVIAQASPPDMRLPISLGLSWPDRISSGAQPCDWTKASSWTFEPLDTEVFPAVEIARRAVAASAWHPAVFNGANEELVDAFLRHEVRYSQIVDTLSAVLDAFDEYLVTNSLTRSVDGVMQADAWARSWVRNQDILA
ncbi:1-deoxy-D-xylulose-5-phosphate reductoisomerase [Jonesia quinghaiensis]|uniref:1-deoxy-D-xylulose-5-phosphate reductoisomerase n=1 Tax=Jonesia quinghaiensis TaxID=262806 RepID=UPI00041DA60A|nr:1-deoxy-D-xylulose-5-phosphate reductoisomerase [Jonesia quinghaiensis]